MAVSTGVVGFAILLMGRFFGAVDIFFEESRIRIRISKKILSRKRQTIRKDRTQSFGFKAFHCYDCQTADFFEERVGSFLFSEVFAEAFSHKNK